MNHLIPSVPIAPRTKADNEKATAHCKKLFTLVDELAQNTNLEFNHSATLGQLAINPEHFGDCAIEYGANRPNFSLIQSHLEQLRYPVFQGEHTIKSALWDCETTVWLFQLNPMKTILNCQKVPISRHKHPLTYISIVIKPIIRQGG